MHKKPRERGPVAQLAISIFFFLHSFGDLYILRTFCGLYIILWKDWDILYDVMYSFAYVKGNKVGREPVNVPGSSRAVHAFDNN